jgi:pimeloyl-ACP methyl ester carboxylesterase
MSDYREWLASELRSIDGHIDLVGHDWGGGHVMNLMMSEPGLVRSWCADVLGIFHPDYVWHDLAQLWQTPDVGEETVAAMAAGTLEERAARYIELGVTDDVATAMAEAMDEAMGRCILALYRDAAQPRLIELAARLPAAATRPGLAIIAAEDTFVGTDEMARWAAAQAGATVASLAGVGHWWMVQDPAAGAAALTSFWASLGEDQPGESQPGER